MDFVRLESTLSIASPPIPEEEGEFEQAEEVGTYPRERILSGRWTLAVSPDTGEGSPVALFVHSPPRPHGGVRYLLRAGDLPPGLSFWGPGFL